MAPFAMSTAAALPLRAALRLQAPRSKLIATMG